MSVYLSLKPTGNLEKSALPAPGRYSTLKKVLVVVAVLGLGSWAIKSLYDRFKTKEKGESSFGLTSEETSSSNQPNSSPLVLVSSNLRETETEPGSSLLPPLPRDPISLVYLDSDEPDLPPEQTEAGPSLPLSFPTDDMSLAYLGSNEPDLPPEQTQPDLSTQQQFPSIDFMPGVPSILDNSAVFIPPGSGGNVAFTESNPPFVNAEEFPYFSRRGSIKLQPELKIQPPPHFIPTSSYKFPLVSFKRPARTLHLIRSVAPSVTAPVLHQNSSSSATISETEKPEFVSLSRFLSPTICTCQIFHTRLWGQKVTIYSVKIKNQYPKENPFHTNKHISVIENYLLEKEKILFRSKNGSDNALFLSTSPLKKEIKEIERFMLGNNNQISIVEKTEENLDVLIQQIFNDLDAHQLKRPISLEYLIKLSLAVDNREKFNISNESIVKIRQELRHQNKIYAMDEFLVAEIAKLGKQSQELLSLQNKKTFSQKATTFGETFKAYDTLVAQLEGLEERVHSSSGALNAFKQSWGELEEKKRKKLKLPPNSTVYSIRNIQPAKTLLQISFEQMDLAIRSRNS